MLPFLSFFSQPYGRGWKRANCTRSIFEDRLQLISLMQIGNLQERTLESGHEEVDILVDQEHTLLPIEIKAGQTIAAGFFERFSSLTGNTIETAALVFGGTQGQTRDKISIYP